MRAAQSERGKEQLKTAKLGGEGEKLKVVGIPAERSWAVSAFLSRDRA